MFNSFKSMYFDTLPDKIIAMLPSMLWSLVIVIVGIWLGKLAGKIVVKILKKECLYYGEYVLLSM